LGLLSVRDIDIETVIATGRMLRRFARLFSAPKGFGKYYPKGSETKGARAGKGNAGKGSSGMGGDGGKKPEFNMPEGGPVRSALLAAGALGAWVLMSKDLNMESGRYMSRTIALLYACCFMPACMYYESVYRMYLSHPSKPSLPAFPSFTIEKFLGRTFNQSYWNRV
jgi:hypothetical protein